MHPSKRNWRYYFITKLSTRLNTEHDWSVSFLTRPSHGVDFHLANPEEICVRSTIQLRSPLITVIFPDCKRAELVSGRSCNSAQLILNRHILESEDITAFFPLDVWPSSFGPCFNLSDHPVTQKRALFCNLVDLAVLLCDKARHFENLNHFKNILIANYYPIEFIINTWTLEFLK